MATYAEQLEKFRTHREKSKELTIALLTDNLEEQLELKYAMRKANGFYAKDEEVEPNQSWRPMRRP